MDQNQKIKGVRFPAFKSYVLHPNGLISRRFRSSSATISFVFTAPEHPAKSDLGFHRPAARRCIACQYWLVQDKDASAHVQTGHCYRFPQLERTFWSRWCGEFKPLLSPWDQLRAWWQIKRRDFYGYRNNLKARVKAYSEARDRRRHEEID